MRQFHLNLDEFIKAVQDAGGSVFPGNGELFVGGTLKSVTDALEAAFPPEAAIMRREIHESSSLETSTAYSKKYSDLEEKTSTGSFTTKPFQNPWKNKGVRNGIGAKAA